MYERRSLLIASLLLLCVPYSSGQLPKRLEKCLPYPTLAQEIRERQPAPERVRVHVVHVNFDPNDGIPIDAQDSISEELQSNEIEPEAHTPYLQNLADGIAEVGVKGALRDRGYFKASAESRLTELWNDGADIGVAVAVRATLGPQYRTGDILIKSADPDSILAISPEILRGLIPLQRGEVFSVERVRTGLENLGRAYGRRGYVDMTPVPDTEVNEAQGNIDLTVMIDQQAQYRVGSIEFQGVNRATRDKLMESVQKPGEIFDVSQLNEFFKVNQAILPADASRDDVSVRRDSKTRTVGILFDFRTCPPNSN